MTITEEWNEFLENMFENALEKISETKEHELIERQESKINELLFNYLSGDKKILQKKYCSVLI